MRRRDFIRLVGGAAATWPIAARAQQPTVPMIGFLGSRSPESDASLVEAFRGALKRAGLIEARDVKIEFRWGRDQNSRLSQLATELVALKVGVLVAVGGAPTAEAAKRASQTTPIVFANGSDPVALGWVASLNHPGGNMTGVTVASVQIGEKLMDLIARAVPDAQTIGLLINSANPNAERLVLSMETAANKLGRDLIRLSAGNESELSRIFQTSKAQGVGALAVSSDPLFTNRRDEVVSLAARYGLPAIYSFREHVEAGGLMSYGANLADALAKAGEYAVRILKGEKAADLPVQQPTRFEFVINLNTAKALGLNLAPTLLALADEVIE